MMAEHDEDLLTLADVASIRGVHYMTIYRHVRTGRLPATKQGGEWRVRRSDLATPSAPAGTPGHANVGSRLNGFIDRIMAADEPGAWTILENCLSSGSNAADLHHLLIVPAMRTVGDRWVDGSIGVAEEHTATAIAQRLVGRLGPMMRAKGRSRGTIVLGAVAHDTHALALTIVADLLRNARYSVIDLGGNTPAESFVEVIAHADRCVAVGIGVSIPSDAAVAETVAAVTAHSPDLPIIVGGRGVEDAEHARRLGSWGYSEDSHGIVPMFDEAIASSGSEPTS